MQFQRKDRVGDSIKREVSLLIQRELKDPGIGFVTITGVEVSADLKRAHIYYIILGYEESNIKTTKALKRACGFIQHEIGKRLRLKHVPEVEFHFDGSVEYGARIEELIRKIHQQGKAGEKETNLPEEKTE
jgi:ribosome-binding factor A